MTDLLRSTRRADIAFYFSGRIDITARLARLLGLREGDVINACAEGGEVYIYLSKRADELVGRHEGQCRASNAGSHNFRAHSKRLCRKFYELSGASESAPQLRFYAGEPAKLGARRVVPIIYRHIVNKP